MPLYFVFTPKYKRKRHVITVVSDRITVAR